jgi:hypothetical protein
MNSVSACIAPLRPRGKVRKCVKRAERRQNPRRCPRLDEAAAPGERRRSRRFARWTSRQAACPVEDKVSGVGQIWPPHESGQALEVPLPGGHVIAVAHPSPRRCAGRLSDGRVAPSGHRGSFGSSIRACARGPARQYAFEFDSEPGGVGAIDVRGLGHELDLALQRETEPEIRPFPILGDLLEKIDGTAGVRNSPAHGRSQFLRRNARSGSARLDW